MSFRPGDTSIFKFYRAWNLCPSSGVPRKLLGSFYAIPHMTLSGGLLFSVTADPVDRDDTVPLICAYHELT